MPWDTNKFVTLECRLCSPIRTLDEIVTGANERCDGVDIALLTAPIELYNLYNIQNLIQAKITTLIPMWIEATMLTAISAGSRLVPSRLGVDREWAVQQYKIINMLRWGKGPMTFSGFGELREGSGATWVDAETNFNLASWIPTTNYFIYTGSDAYPYYLKEAQRNQYLISNSIQFTGDFYSKPVSYWGFFQPLISSPLENLWNKSYTMSVEGLSDSFYYPFDSDVTAPFIEPGASLISWLINLELDSTPNTDRNTFVQKFDGANGFTYRGDDW